MPVMYYIAKFFYWALFIAVGLAWCKVLVYHLGGKNARSKKNARKWKRGSVFDKMHQSNLRHAEASVQGEALREDQTRKKVGIETDLAAGRADPNEAAKTEFFDDHTPQSEDDLQWVNGIYQPFLRKEDDE